MEDQSEQGMADQAFRPFNSLLLSASAVAEQHASSSDNNLSSLHDYMLPDEAGTSSMSRSGEGYELLSSSSDSEEEDDGEARVKEDVAGDASAMER